MWVRGPDGRPELGQSRLCVGRRKQRGRLNRRFAEDKQFSRYRRAPCRGDTPSVRTGVLARVSTVVGGDRKVFAITDVSAASGSAGLASDVTEIENVSAEYERPHCATTGPTRSDQSQHRGGHFRRGARKSCRFVQPRPFQKLWNLDTVFLEGSAPDHALLLDRLRSDGMLAEQPGVAALGRRTLLYAYRRGRSAGALVASAGWAHGSASSPTRNPRAASLGFREPDRKDRFSKAATTRAVRVAGRDARQSGRGACAVFGPDGRLRLVNPAFSLALGACRQASPTPARISRSSAVSRLARRVVTENSPVESAPGRRDGLRRRTPQQPRPDRTPQTARCLRYAIIHLPNGQGNDHLRRHDRQRECRTCAQGQERGAGTRRISSKNDFVQHVSYELRSPLTNIIGFTELLAMPETGAAQRPAA